MLIYLIMCNDCYDGRVVEAWKDFDKAHERVRSLGPKYFVFQMYMDVEHESQ